MQEPIDRYFAANMFEPKVVMRFDNADFIRSMVQAGLGIALLPLWVVQRDLKEKHLSMIRPAEATPFSKIALIRRKSNYIPRPVQGFIETASALPAKDVPLLTVFRRPASPDSRRVKPA
jgi:DNA-binding transcriptional LysR family regulator